MQRWKSLKEVNNLEEKDEFMKQLVIIGASGHGRVVADIAKKNGYDDIIFLDDNIQLKTCGKYKVCGTSQKICDYSSEFFVAIGNQKVRTGLLTLLEQKKCKIARLIHPSAIISDDVVIGCGTVVMAGVVINAGAVIGKGCIINTSSSIDHDCIVEDYVHISVGCHLAGTVKVGQNTWLGAGSIVSNNISITKDCILGAGAVVVKDVNESGIYKGIPAKKE